MGWTGFRPLTLVLIMILSLAGWLQHCDFAVRYLWESIEFCSVGFFKDQGREAWPLDESKFVSHCRDSAHGSRWQEALRVALVTHVMKSCQTSNPFPHVPHEVVKSVLLRLQFITMADFQVKYPKLFVSCIFMFNASPITLNMQLNWAVFKTLHRFDGTGWFIDPSKQTTYIYIYMIYSLIQLAYYIRHTTGDPGGCPNWPNGTDGTGESKVSSVRTVTVGGIWMWGWYDLEMNMLNVLKPASYHQTSSVQTNIKHHKTIQPIQIYPWN